MMVYRIKAFLVLLIILVHLHATAGEPIHIKGTLLPVITIAITVAEAESIRNMPYDKAAGLLAIYMVINDTAASVPISGHYSISDRKLSFTPNYSLGEGMEFEVVCQSGGKVNKRRFKTPARVIPQVSTHVITAYPTCDTIPYNTLFFHIRFSNPMTQDVHAYKYVHMYDDAGMERLNAWRQKSFWLDSGRLLVLMIHPGRVKNGIHYESPLFDSGKYYKLVVEKNIKDINENALVNTYEQRFFIKGEDRISPIPDINDNKLPAANTSDPLFLSFDEGMDYASVFDGVRLYNNAGTLISFKLTSEPGEHNFAITPSRRWAKGKYSIVLKGAVYDFAANRINRVFEITDIHEVEKDKIDRRIDFYIK